MYLANFKLSEFALKWFVNESFNDINDELKEHSHFDFIPLINFNFREI